MRRFESQFRVYYGDTDAGGIVYHAQYLNFAERARVEAIRSLGLSLPQLLKQFGCLFVVARAGISYVKPLYLDDLMTVKTTVKDLKRVTIDMEQCIYRGSVLCAKLDIVLACVESTHGRPSRIPSLWYDVLKKTLV